MGGYLFVLLGAAGYGAGSLFTDHNRKKIIAREVYLQDYMRQHPEDFPESVPTKFKDVLQPWHPVR